VTTASRPRPVSPTAQAVPPVPFRRLVRGELRKTVDTRSGRWLVAAIGLVTVVAVVVAVVVAEPGSLTFRAVVGVTSAPQSLLLPVLAILATTSEWSQRTALITYTLEPDRTRVALAKLAAVVAIGLLAVVVALAVAAIGTAVGMPLAGGSDGWALSAADGRELVLTQVLALLQATAFAMLLMSTPAALVVYYLVPALWSSALTLVDGLEPLAPWLDLGAAVRPLYSGGLPSTGEWAQLAVAATLWLLLPMGVGLFRLVHREVKAG